MTSTSNAPQAENLEGVEINHAGSDDHHQDTTPHAFGSAPVEEFLDALTAAGHPVLTFGDRFPAWKGVTGTDGNRAAITHHREAPGAHLAAVMAPGAFAVLDVDPRNGGDAPALRDALAAAGVPVYAEVHTGGAGTHYYVPSPARPSGDKIDALAEHPGVDVKTTGLVFLPGTMRTKAEHRDEATGRPRPYRLAWSRLVEGTGDADGAERFADWLDTHRPQRAAPAATAAATPALPALGAQPEEDGTRRRLRGSLAATATRLARETTGGRNQALNDAALWFGHAADHGLTRTEVHDALRAACQHNGVLDDDGPATFEATFASGWDTGTADPWPLERILPDRGGQTATGDLRDVFTPGTTASATTAPAGTPATSDLHEGETRMAYRLATAYQDRLMHVHGFGWFAWDGRRWEEDKVGHARRALIDVLAQDLRAALEDRDRDRVNALRKIERDAAQRGVLKIAEDLPAFARTIDDLDADPWLLNTANGTLDLRTMALRPHDPADRITKVTRGAYRPEDLDGSRWARFLSSTLPDGDVRAFLARYVGQALTGRVLEHKLAILTGTGRNGKGTFYGALGFALGEYATVVEPDLLLHRDGAHPTGEMDLRGVRWAVVSETDEGRKLAMSTVKRLTGGDRIRARRMRQDFVEFDASHTLALITNHLPRVDGDDPAIWARLRVIPFDQKFDTGGRRPVKDLPEQLEADADAVLSWAVAGWEDYRHRDGLDEPAAVVAATENYHAGADHVGRFLEERTRPVTDASARPDQLFAAWQQWAAAEGIHAGTKKEFGTILDRRIGPAKKSNGVRLRRGILLIDPDGGQQ